MTKSDTPSAVASAKSSLELELRSAIAREDSAGSRAAVLRRDGFRVFFFSDEGWEPPHVHVERGGGIVKYCLNPVAMAYCDHYYFGT
jgi:hypothetical protein